MATVKIIVFDTTNFERGMSLGKMFASCADTMVWVYNGCDGADRWECLSGDNLPLAKKSDVLVLHDNDLDSWTRVKQRGGHSCTHDVRYTGEGPPRERGWINFGVTEHSVLSRAQAQNIVAATRGGFREYPSVLRPLEICEALSALAILCQGYLAVHAVHDKEVKIWGPPEIAAALEQMGWPQAMANDQIRSALRPDRACPCEAPRPAG